MDKNINHYPSKQELKDATVTIIQNCNGQCTTKYINDMVAKKLDLSEEYLTLEDDSGLGTVFNYRMRWIRTELKKEGKIVNIKRGIWKKS
ncbi:MAG: winged helix-turn-helix domain-containing protein [Lachnospiraceae bacterium]